MEVDFQHRSPKPDDVIKVGMVDLQDGDCWTELGQTRSWCWQQGCMLQWLPGSKNEVMWNDRQDGRFVSYRLNVTTGEKKTLPHPFYTISSNKAVAVAPDFRRVNDMRPGYGYTPAYLIQTAISWLPRTQASFVWILRQGSKNS